MFARRFPAALVLALASAAGCAVGPDYEGPPAVKTERAFGAGAAEGLSAEPIVADWWTTFGDPVLTDLVRRAERSNIDVEVAAARVREARVLRTAAMLELFPIATADASHTRGMRSEASMNGLGSRDLREIDLYSAGFDATWELDIFGRVRRGVESNDAEIERAVAERRDLLVIVSAEVARTYVELRGTQGRLAVARRNAQNQRDTLEVVDSRVRGGTANELDLARARAQLASTVAQIPGLEATAARAIHRLGVLVGEPPTALVRELSAPRPIPTLPPVLQIGDPGALVQRRADIRAADHALHAATARVGVAKADFFPRVSFNGRVALEANVLKDLGKAGNESYAFGPSISWAAFDMGRVNAYYQAAGARAEAAHARYRQTVLLALEDVESSLVTFGRERTRRELLREAASANETAAELARERYRNGLADFLTVLDAERRVLESDDQLAEGETRTASALVAVYKALGGGWQ